MKKLLALSLVALMAGTAMAQQPALGMFFSNTDFIDQQTDFVPTLGVPFQAYLVMLGAGFTSLGGYECGITEDSGGLLFVTTVEWPNNGLNFGGNLNHLVGYGTPLPVGGDGTVVLCTMNMLYSGTATVEFTAGPATPPSVPSHNGPVFADNANPDDLVLGTTTNGSPNAVIATLNGDGITPVEATSLTAVKSLFE